MLLAFIFVITPILLLLLTLYLKINFKDNYLFWVFFIIFFFLFYFIPVINYGSTEFAKVQFDSAAKGHISNTDSVMKLYIFQTLFFLLFLIGYKMKKTKIINGISNYSFPLSVNHIIIFTSLLSLLGTYGTVYFSGMSLEQLSTTSRFDYWETKSTFPHLLSSYIQSLLVISAFLIPFSKNTKPKVIAAISLAGLFYIEMMIFGSRTTFMAVGAAFVIGVISFLRYKKQKIKIMKIAIPGILLLHLMVVWQYVRYNSSTLHTFGDWIFAIFNIKEAYHISLFSGDLNYFFGAALATFDAVPSDADYIYGTSYLRMMIFFLPSSLVPFKPEETQRIFAEIVNPSMYNIGATIPPSFIGDSYLNFGFLGIMVGLGLGLLIKVWQNCLNGPMGINKITIGSAGFLFLLLFIRGTFNGMINLIFVWMFLMTLSFIIGLFTKKQEKDKGNPTYNQNHTTYY